MKPQTIGLVQKEDKGNNVRNTMKSKTKINKAQKREKESKLSVLPASLGVPKLQVVCRPRQRPQ
jgi:hypothetical protein